jgi:RimJ/RimL family protein N-acetyltransferase
MDNSITAKALEDKTVKLEPLSNIHYQGLLSALKDGELYKLWFTSVPAPDQLEAYLKQAIQLSEQGKALAFAVVCKRTQSVVGSTRFCNLDLENRRLEIGYTWYAQRAQRTAINTSVKRLMLEFAFEELDLIAVEFRTHYLNHASNRAILRLGAKLDGMLRSHKLLADGSIRDTMVYSIIRSEWLAVKIHLGYLLNQDKR